VLQCLGVRREKLNLGRKETPHAKPKIAKKETSMLHAAPYVLGPVSALGDMDNKAI
jgi:hypothetical protein